MNHDKNEFRQRETLAAVTEALASDADYGYLYNILYNQYENCFDLWRLLIDFSEDLENHFQDKWESRGGDVDFIETIDELVYNWITVALTEGRFREFSEIYCLTQNWKNGSLKKPERPARKNPHTVCYFSMENPEHGTVTLSTARHEELLKSHYELMRLKNPSLPEGTLTFTIPGFNQGKT